MLVDHWPLLGLRLRTPRLELRLPGPEELAALADLAAAGIHQPEQMPFAVPWTDAEPEARGRSVVQHHWLAQGSWSSADWRLHLAVFEDGRVVGIQSIAAREFPVLRQVTTGSWLGLPHHGRGIGTEMRAAALELAFAGLRAREARSAAFADNTASLRVSTKLGYRPDGTDHHPVRGRSVLVHRMLLTRDTWSSSREVPVSISGLRPCLPLFGLPVPPG